MKKDIRTLAALLIASATFVACSSDDDSIIENQQPVNPTVKYTMTINASKGDEATTRALTPDGHTLNATWATTEHVYVKKDLTWATGSLQPQEAGENTTLKGELSGITIAASDGLTLQFPRSGDITYDGQVGTLADIAANFDYATASVKVASVSSSGNINPEAAMTTFVNQQAIVKFTLKNGDAAISATELIVNDGTNAYIVTPASGTDVIYVAIPGFSDKTVTLTATDGANNIYTYQKSGVTFTNGKYYEISVKMTPDTRKDLSMVDCAGIARASMWTANCYMVHSAGYYQLPLVYGNAIKNGEANAFAFNPGGTTGTNYCANFVNHAGNAITAPWIKDNSTTVTSAELLWQDAQGLITKVGISGDYLTLTVGKNATTQEGNALVAAKDADDNIVWSWHIWVTKQTFATDDLKDFAAEIKNGNNTTSYTYKVTPVNLGWVGEATSTTGYCTFYQWGRKDAFIPSTGTNDNANHTVYDNNGATVTGYTYTTDNSTTIGGNIQHPTVFNHNSSTTGPCNTQYYNMWDAQRTSHAIDATPTVKTVYDPCPPGFCVPTIGLYYNIAVQTEHKWENYYTYNGVYFPVSGYRGYGSGNLESVGLNGCYWSATPADGGTDSRWFDIGSSVWVYNTNYRTYGYPVRAVAEAE